MAVSGLDHINITSTKLEATRDFFVNILGLTDGYRPDFPVPGHWLYLGDRPIVHLMDLGETKSGSSASSLDHAAFITDDYDGVIAKLDDAGIKYTKREVPDGSVRQVFFEDPNGVMIEVGQRNKS